MTSTLWTVLCGLVRAQSEAGVGKFFRFQVKPFREEVGISAKAAKVAMRDFLAAEVLARKLGQKSVFVMDPVLFIRNGGDYFQRMIDDYKNLLVLCARHKQASSCGIVPDENGVKRFQFQTKGKRW